VNEHKADAAGCSVTHPRRDGVQQFAMRLACGRQSAYSTPMSWDADDVALLKKLWSVGQSAAQIARRLGYSRNAVCAKLTRLDLKRSHKVPTAKPKIRPGPKRRPALLAACARPAVKVVSRKKVTRQPKEFSKRQLYAILAEAVRNTG
jgi:GcrA cell cycle regulator